MGASGLIDWHRLDRTKPWTRNTQGQHTYVYAFWLVDHGHATTDTGVAVLKPEGRHADWFIHADSAENVLAAYTQPRTHISPNFTTVFHNNLSARPLIGSLLLGTADAVYWATERLWWASYDDLTWPGKRLMKRLNSLYEREGVLVTFIDGMTDENSGPRDPSS